MKGAADDRLATLALWMGSRLESRQAIAWVTKAFKGEKGLSTQDLVLLLRDLADRASRKPDLAPEIRKIWHLFYRASLDRESRFNSYHAEQFKRDIREGVFRPEDVKTLVDFTRPRLKPSEPSRFVVAEEGFVEDPRRWVIWGFETASGMVDEGIGRISRKILSALPSNVLAQISAESTSTLAAAIDLARDVDWIGDGRDLANSYVARLSFDPTQAASSVADDEDDQESRDPDAYHDGFAPLLRLMTAAFDILAENDPDAARRIAIQWDGHTSALFVRLQAYAGLCSLLWEGSRVGQFLLQLSDLQFWRWGAFPEVASLRALRWGDIPIQVRDTLVERLVTGPQRDEFDPDEISEEAILYRRDHEIARVVDNNENAPNPLLEIAKDRRATDGDFPARVPAVEVISAGARFRRVPNGDPERFNNVSHENIIAELAKATRNRAFGEGNHAEAFARKYRHKVVDLLTRSDSTDSDIATVWELALSYPHDKPDDLKDAREVAEQIAKRALEMEIEFVKRLVDRLCYWLDATDEQLKEFSGAISLWERLFPLAVDHENARTPSDSVVEADLSSAALNVPLGHLFSFFFRRCPTMPAQGERPPLPMPFVSLLKQIKGRAQALFANRMATSMNYFWRADPSWLMSFVLNPMLSNHSEGVPLWEAFAKYGPVPNSSLWQIAEEAIFAHLARGRLSKEALRRLAEMAIVVWSWTKVSESNYLLDAAGLRSALGISSDEVRGAAAWQLSQLIDREDDETKDEAKEKAEPTWGWPSLGPSFFSEVWPLEPAVQSPQSANDFARIPSLAGTEHYSSAVRTVMPFLRPFEIWDIDTTFGLTEETNHLVLAHPTETLALIAACVPDNQKHSIYRLGRVLSLIMEVKGELERDPEFRRVRKFVTND